MLNNKQLALKLNKELCALETQSTAIAAYPPGSSQLEGSKQMADINKKQMQLNYQKTILMNEQFIN